MLNIYFHRKFSGFIAAACAVVAVAGGIAFARAGNAVPLFVQLFGWLIILLMVWGCLVGLRQILKPPLMYKIDRRGVMIYYDADRIRFGGNGVFLPWRSVTSLALEKRKCVNSDGSSAYTWVIACALKDKAPFQVQQHSSAYSLQDGQQVVCLDAFTGTVSRQSMLDQLLSFWAVGR